MSQGTIVTIVTEADSPTGLEAAIETARRLSLHLDVICLTPAIFQMPPITVADAFVPPLVNEDAETDLQEIERAVAARLSREEIAWSVDGVITSPAALAPQLAPRLRLADLALLPKTGGIGDQAARLFEVVLYNSRVPILLTDTGLRTLDRVTIAWDESDVALAAVRGAMPVLQAAGAVEIVTVDMPDAGEDLAAMLSRKGVTPEILPLARGEASIADRLMAHAMEARADALVAGAYGHARLREVLLGGVTRDLLRRADLPLILSR